MIDIDDFKRKKLLIDDIAVKYCWSKVSDDKATGRISYTDDLNIFRIDIYTSKMTVCILPKSGNPTYKKKQNMKMIDQIFKNPFKY